MNTIRLHYVSSKIRLHIPLQDQRLPNEAIINNEVQSFWNCNKIYASMVSRDVFKTFAKVIEAIL